MLPEAESINKDGSQVLILYIAHTLQLIFNNLFCTLYLLYMCTPVLSITLLYFQDGLMEAANIPLQSKEEDQMWKILKTDERYCQRYFHCVKFHVMRSVIFSSIPFMCNWIYKNNSRHKYRKWNFLHHSHDGSQTKWKPSSLAKVESDINFVYAAPARARVNPWFSKKSFLWTSQRKEVSHMSHSCDVNKVNKHRSYSCLQQTAWPFSKDSIFRRETWTNEKERSLLESSSSSNKGRVNIKSRIIIPFSCKEFPFKSVKCQTKFTNSLSLTTEK